MARVYSTGNPEVDQWIAQQHAEGKHAQNCPDWCEGARRPERTPDDANATRAKPTPEQLNLNVQIPNEVSEPTKITNSEIDGSALLDAVHDWYGRFIRTVTAADLDLLAVWTVHTHLVNETYTTPRLQIDSPVPEAGKTTCLDHMHRLCREPVLAAVLTSSALLTRMLQNGKVRTILIDEADRSLNPDKDGITDLMAVINSGYKRGATRPVLVPGKGGEWKIEEMPTYAPVALAGNAPNLPDDTRTRILRVLLLPDLDGLAEESDWEQIEPKAKALADKIAVWADSVRDSIKTCRPDLPDGITGRFREKWGPLRRVAELAGGDWPTRIDALALHDKEQYLMDKEDGLIRDRPHIVLLRDLAEVWPDGKAFAPTSELIGELVSRYPEMWGAESTFGKPLTAHRMGRMLAGSYKVNSKRPDTQGPRGYLLAHLTQPMIRLGITPPHDPDKAAEAAEPDSDSSASAGSAGLSASTEGGDGSGYRP